MDTNIGIYKITSPTNKVYIGQSRNIKKRKYSHKSKPTRTRRGMGAKLYNSIKKHGWNAHKFEVLLCLEKNVDQTLLDRLEVFYWQQAINCGYEMLNGREPGRGGRLTKEHIEKIRQANLGKVISEDTREKLKQANLGKTLSEEHKRKLSEAGKGRKFSKEHREKLSKSSLGNKSCTGLTRYGGNGTPQEVKDKISASLKKRYEEGYQGTKGKKHSKETKKKISEIAKKRYRNKPHPSKGRKVSDETKEKLRRAHLGKKQSEETKRKKSESGKRAWDRIKTKGEKWRKS